MTRLACAAATACLILSAAPFAFAKEPDIPPGLDPGGIAIALLGQGIDYVRPEFAQRLARDGEGDLIAWDFIDSDTKPYAAAGPSNDDAHHLVTSSPDLKLVVVKEPTGNPAAIGHMASFTIRTPARIILWPDGSPQRPDWPVLFQAAKRFSDRLFIVSGPLQSSAPETPKNVVAPMTSSGGNPRTAALNMAIRAVDILKKSPSLPIADLQKALNR